MHWIDENSGKLPIKSWCEHVDTKALLQAANLADHSQVFHHVALMPDCHVGYGMPIGGVIACPNAVIPNAVGVDIGCGMVASQTNVQVDTVTRRQIEDILREVRRRIPVGEGHSHRSPQTWSDFDRLPHWLEKRTAELAPKNLGTLGGGNHFIELQAGDDGFLWLMIHSGSRNLGYKIAEHHHRIAQRLNREMSVELPDKDLAYLPTDTSEAKNYIDEMQFALDYAAENRARMMEEFRFSVRQVLKKVDFEDEVNIHHNYAGLEEHFGRKVWVHRKGATSAKLNEMGIIPGSMGTPSYIVRGLGNEESFMSCSHGAGRTMGRNEASRTLSKEECDRAMEGIVFEGWKPMRGRGRQRGMLDLSEAPLAYKDIEDVIDAERDLIEPVVKLIPLGVVKG